jgi:fumarate reductase flavoprotein subunit
VRILSSVFISVLAVFFLLVAPKYIPEKADVVIIGAGAAGMRAAMESQLYTDKIVLLEKMSYPGGNSNRASGGFNAALSTQDQMAYQRDTMEAGHFQGNESLIRIMIEHSGEALKWLQDQGADLSDRGLLAGHGHRRTFRPSGGSPVGREITSVLLRAVTKQGIDLRTENKALSITQKKNSLMVLVQNPTGREYRIRARSVIIATGGFGGNLEMVVRYNPKMKGFNTTNSPGASGDFINLTRDLPVKLVHLEDIQTHPTVEPDFGILITEALRGNGGILVNSQGLRFTDELAFREVLTRKIQEENEDFIWLIFDQGVRESLLSSEYYFEKELVWAGDTILTLAEKIALPETNLETTLQVWNESVRQGVDNLFQRQDLSVPLESPPYYAIKVTPGIHYCMGGLAINEQAQVLDTQDGTIAGLYAAGEATGGIHGKDRLGGNSLIDAMVFGEIAGREAALYALDRDISEDL